MDCTVPFRQVHWMSNTQSVPTGQDIELHIYIYIHMLIADIQTTTRHAPCRPLWRYPVQRDSNHHDQLSTINMMGISKFRTMNG
jgi:hypothetical protein